VALTACGGGSSNTAATTPAVVQPAFKSTDTVTGTGTVAAAGDLLVVNYVGYLYDSSKADLKGAKFDSSIDRNVPFTFTIGVGKVIPGWDQGILGMKAGGKRTLVVPAAMAYGANPRDAQAAVGSNTYAAIPANSPLVFDVELVSVVTATVPVVVPPPTTLVLQDTVIGTGTEATAGKSITVHYTGYLYDGSRVDFRGYLFDSDSGKTPLAFKVGAGGVIKGFDDGVLGMKIGGKRTITIPPSLGYGATANGAIPANSTLIFDVELLTVQ
jgi:peptidylprolyl isomerase